MKLGYLFLADNCDFTVGKTYIDERKLDKTTGYMTAHNFHYALRIVAPSLPPEIIDSKHTNIVEDSYFCNAAIFEMPDYYVKNHDGAFDVRTSSIVKCTYLQNVSDTIKNYIYQVKFLLSKEELSNEAIKFLTSNDKRFLFTAERLLHFLLSNQPDFVKNKRDSLLSNPVWEFHQLIIEKLVGSSEEIQNYYSPYEFNYDNKGKLWINERI